MITTNAFATLRVSTGTTKQNDRKDKSRSLLFSGSHALKARRSASSKSALLSSSVSTTTNSDNNNDLVKENNSSNPVTIQERLMKISNIASLLCVVDCTVLPVVTVALPLLGIGTSASTAAWLHDLGHSIALYFVLPVGGLAATMNYFNHNKKNLLSLSLVGLFCVYAANGNGGPILSLLPHSLAHNLHCGTTLHRVVNIVGCVCLLGSNHLGKIIGGCGIKDCGVDHGNGINGDAEIGSSCCHDHGHGGHDHSHTH